MSTMKKLKSEADRELAKFARRVTAPITLGWQPPERPKKPKLPPPLVISTTTEEDKLEGDYCEVAGLRTTCDRCGHEVESFGTGPRSRRRNFWLLSEECPEADENNLIDGRRHYYVGGSSYLDDDDDLSLNASELPANVGLGAPIDLRDPANWLSDRDFAAYAEPPLPEEAAK